MVKTVHQLVEEYKNRIAEPKIACIYVKVYTEGKDNLTACFHDVSNLKIGGKQMRANEMINVTGLISLDYVTAGSGSLRHVDLYGAIVYIEEIITTEKPKI